MNFYSLYRTSFPPRILENELVEHLVLRQTGINEEKTSKLEIMLLKRSGISAESAYDIGNKNSSTSGDNISANF